jgi:hypothetical protein
MLLGKRAFGISCGLIWGLVIMIGTWFILLRGAPGEMISKLSTFYIGYSTSFLGGVVGFIYGFITGFVGGFLIALFYNLTQKKISKT